MNGHAGRVWTAAGALLVILIGLAALVGPVKTDLDAHTALPAHPTSQAWKVAEDREASRLEAKVDRIDQNVDEIKGTVTRLEALAEQAVRDRR